MREFTLSFALILLFAGVLSGQTEKSLRVLALPDSQPIFCRVPDDEPAHPFPPEMVARLFGFGKPPGPDQLAWSREIRVMFDTLGHAVFLLDERSFGRFGSETVSALLDSTGTLSGTRIDITVDSAAQERAIAEGDIEGGLAATRPAVTRPLTADERKQMSALTEWLWKRRCPPR